jgi:hypothetical protein
MKLHVRVCYLAVVCSTVNGCDCCPDIAAAALAWNDKALSHSASIHQQLHQPPILAPIQQLPHSGVCRSSS